MLCQAIRAVISNSMANTTEIFCLKVNFIYGLQETLSNFAAKEGDASAKPFRGYFCWQN
jgi:hypothetical protein